MIIEKGRLLELESRKEIYTLTHHSKISFFHDRLTVFLLA